LEVDPPYADAFRNGPFEGRPFASDEIAVTGTDPIPASHAARLWNFTKGVAVWTGDHLYVVKGSMAGYTPEDLAVLCRAAVEKEELQRRQDVERAKALIASADVPAPRRPIDDDVKV